MAPGTVRRSTSSEKSPAGRRLSSTGRGSPTPLEPGMCGALMSGASDALVGGRRCPTDVAAATGRDQLHDLRRTAPLRGDHGRNPALEKDGDAVGDLHHVIHVV